MLCFINVPLECPLPRRRGQLLARCLGDGKDFRAAGRAPVHLIRQTSHLRVAALLAGVPTESIGQLGYLMERLEEIPAEKACTRRTAHRRTPAEFEFIHLAEGATEGVELSGCRIFHDLALA
jgi:hypothetical protein